MKALFIFFVSFFLLTHSYTQEKLIKRAIKENASVNAFFTVDFDKPYNSRKVIEKCRKHGYEIFDFKKKIFNQFGRETEGYEFIVIATKEHIKQYELALAQQQKEIKKNQGIQIVIGLGVLTGMVAAASYGVNKMAKSAGHEDGLSSLVKEANREYKRDMWSKKKNIPEISNKVNNNKEDSVIEYPEIECIKSDSRKGYTYIEGKKASSYTVRCNTGKQYHYLYLPVSYSRYKAGYYRYNGDDMITGFLSVFAGEDYNLVKENDDHKEKDSPILQAVLEKLCNCK